MQKTEPNHVQPNSGTTMGPAAACGFSGCIMPVMASSGQGSERLNAQLLVDSIPALIHTAGPDGYLDYFNKPWLEYLGVTLDKVTGWNWTAFVHPEDVEGIVAKWRACLATGEIFEYETRVRSANGDYRWMFHRKVPLRDANGNIVKWYGSSLDIDERKTAEEQLRRNAEELQRSEFYLAEGQRLAHVGSWAFDPDGFYYWSPELFRMHGLDPASKPPSVQEYLDRVHPHDRESMTNLIKGILAKASPFDATKRIVRPNGEVRYIRCVSAPVVENQRLKKYVGSAIDVTEHELLTQDLRRREAYLAEAQSLSHTGSFGWKPATGEIVWSDETYRIFEYDRVKKPTMDMVSQRVHPEDRADFLKVIDGASAGASHFEHTYRLLLPDGSVKHVHALAHALQDASGNREFVGAATDVTSIKRAEEELRKSEAYLVEAQSLTHTGSWAWNVGTDERFWSEETFRIFEIDPVKVKPAWSLILDRVHPDDRASLLRRKKMESTQTEWAESEADFRIVVADGKIKHLHSIAHPVMDASGQIIEVIGTVMDVTERKRAEGLRDGESRILEMIARDAPLQKILENLVRVVEAQFGGLLCSILLLDEDGQHVRHAAAPSLPKPYIEAINGLSIGPQAGSCGTAMYRRKPVVVTDILQDPLWESYRAVAGPHGLRACWSTPILAHSGKVLGSFAMYYREPRSPSPSENRALEMATHLAGIAIEHKLTRERLQRSEAYLTEAQKLTHTASWAWRVPDRKAVHLSEEFYRIFGFDPTEGAPTWEEYLERVHPEDHLTWKGITEQAIVEKADYDQEFRILLPNGMVKWIH